MYNLFEYGDNYADNYADNYTDNYAVYGSLKDINKL